MNLNLNPNTIAIFLILSSLSRKQGNAIPLPAYFDTFQMELLLDRLHGAVDALERVNKLNQIIREPATPKNSAKKIKESVDTVKGLLPEGPQLAQLNNLSGAIDTIKQFGDMQGLMQAMGPMLKMLSASAQSQSVDDSYDDDGYDDDGE